MATDIRGPLASPRALWLDVWDVIYPMFNGVMTSGMPIAQEDAPYFYDRHGFLEEMYFNIGFIAARDDSSNIGGIFFSLVETTRRVLAERRIATLSALAAEHTATTVERASERALAALATNSSDVPFALLYLLDGDGTIARLAGSIGLDALPPESAARPASVDLTQPGDAAGWPLAQALERGEPVAVDDLATRVGADALPGGPWPEPARSALVLPLAASTSPRPAGFLVLGASPRLPFDSAYREFFTLAAGEVAAIIANAQAHEAERQRVEALDRAGPRQDRLLQQHLARVPHPAHAAARPAGGRALASDRHRRPARRPAHGHPRRSRDCPSQRAPPVEAGQLPARLRAHRGRSRPGGLRAGGPPRLHRRTGVRVPQRHRARGPAPRGGLPPATRGLRARLRGSRNVGTDRPQSALQRLQVHLHRRDSRLAGPHPRPLPRKRERGAGGSLSSGSPSPKGGGGWGERSHPHRLRHRHRHPARGTAAYLRAVPPRGARAWPHPRGIGYRSGAGARSRRAARRHGGRGEPRGRGNDLHRAPPHRHGPSAHRAAPRRARAPGRRFHRTRGGALCGRSPALAARYARRWREHGGGGANHSRAGQGRRRPYTNPYLRAHPAGGGQRRHACLCRSAAPRAGLGCQHRARWRGALTAIQHRADGLAYDLVVSDIMLPRLDGLALLRALRADPTTRALPVVLLSARAGEEARVEGLEAGADDYLVKPFAATELVARVRAHLELTRLRAHLAESAARELALSETAQRMEEFLARASHELRTPLTSLKMNIDLLARQSSTGKVTSEGLRESTRRQMRRMERLVSDLLDNAQIQEGRFALRTSRVDHGAVVHETVDDARHAWPDRELRLDGADSEPLWVEADSDRLIQALTSFLTNAITYSDPGQPVTVTPRREGQMARVAVRDAGPGVPRADQRRIWERYERAQGQRHRSGSKIGLGLGLYLTREIIHQHGGQIGLDSVPSHGSTFWLTVPLAGQDGREPEEIAGD